MGIILVIIGLSVLILVHELGHFLAAKFFGVKVDEFGIGFPPRILSRRKGETLYSLNLLPFGGFVKMEGEDGEEGVVTEENKTRRFDFQPLGRRTLIITAGVIMNVFLGWVLLMIVFTVGTPAHLLVADVTENSPAAVADLRSGDVIVSANYGEKSLSDPIVSQDFIDLAWAAGGQKINLTVSRNDQILEKTIESRKEPPANQGPLGAGLVEIGWPAQNFFQGIISAFGQTFLILKQTIFGFYFFFSKLFVEPAVLDSVSGPVGIFSVALQASSLGFPYFLHLLALLSLNLAVLNILPLPALDGGRLVFLLIEKIKKSPVAFRWQAIANVGGFVLLIGLVILITVKDLKNIF
ncbi:MAG: site-2 protease family protein [bacterium]|nr:site-2 protease family protein [bacterium]